MVISLFKYVRTSSDLHLHPYIHEHTTIFVDIHICMQKYMHMHLPLYAHMSIYTYVYTHILKRVNQFCFDTVHRSCKCWMIIWYHLIMFKQESNLCDLKNVERHSLLFQGYGWSPRWNARGKLCTTSTWLLRSFEGPKFKVSLLPIAPKLAPKYIQVQVLLPESGWPHQVKQNIASSQVFPWPSSSKSRSPCEQEMAHLGS